MKNVAFVIAIVIYNRKIDEISSWKEFLSFQDRYDNVDIFICDNSDATISKNNSLLVNCRYSDRKVRLINNEGLNLGLSINCNKAIDYANSIGKDYWLFISDDDTFFSHEYLDNVYNATVTERCDLISGIITKMSPLRRHGVWAFRKDFIVNLGEYRDIFCINSGLTIHKSVINQLVKYDESLFLDMIDYWLMDWLIEHNLNRILIVDGEIHQTFSAKSDTDISKVKKRFEIFKSDFSKYCKLTGKSALFKVTILWRRRLVILLMELGIIRR